MKVGCGLIGEVPGKSLSGTWSSASPGPWVMSFSSAAAWFWAAGAMIWNLLPWAEASPPCLISGKKKETNIPFLTAQGYLTDFIFLGSNHCSLLWILPPCCGRVNYSPSVVITTGLASDLLSQCGVSRGSNRTHRWRIQIPKTPLGHWWYLVRLGLFSWRIPV